MFSHQHQLFSNKVENKNRFLFLLFSFFIVNNIAFAQKTPAEVPKAAATAPKTAPIKAPPKPVITVAKKIDALLSSPPQKIPYYSPNVKTGEVLWLNMSFVSAVVENEAQVAEKLRGANVVRIDLIYSDYPKDKTPISLNQSRLRALANVDSTLFTQPEIQWNVFAQTACTDKKSAAELFHGIVVVYRPRPAVVDRKKELQDLKSYLDELTMPTVRYVSPKGDTINAPEAFTNGLTLDEGEVGGYSDYGKTSVLAPKKDSKTPPITKDTAKIAEPEESFGEEWKAIADSVYKAASGKTFMFKRPTTRDRVSQRKWQPRSYVDPMTGDTLLLSDHYYPTNYTIDTTWLRPVLPALNSFSAATMPTKSRNPNLAVNDTVVTAALNRQKNTWKQELIVMDVTASMSPYVAQLMSWFHTHCGDNKLRHFTFFNDGDSNPDGAVGKTGGVYHIKADNFNAIKDGVQEVMQRGGGGNAPENDIEALIKGIKACPECGDVVLIADNWAPIRDKSISAALNLLKKPIHIILCGVDWGINTEYLELARDTGGSVHLVDTDITDLSALKDGGTITIRGIDYLYKDGKLIAK
ncbi:MAG: hypothetical protein RI894_2531 [Bacteroidota bacterium]|jgi:hypothetical protein